MGGTESTAPSVEDQRLWARIRIVMGATILIGLVALGANALRAHLLTGVHEESIAFALGLERTRSEAVALGEAALAAAAPRGPAQGMLARERLARLHGSVDARLAAILGELAQRGDAEGSALFGARPHQLSAARAEIGRAVARLRAAPEAGSRGERSRLARRVRLLAESRLARGLELLADRESARGADLARRLRRGEIVFALAALLAFLALWRWGWRPILQAVEDRTSALVAANARAAQNLLFDAMTGLPNRRNLHERLGQMAEGGPLGILHIDLCGFHAVNTTLGRRVGDQMVICAARNLEELALGTDLLARIDTDEFVLATVTRTDPDQLQELAVEIIETLARPISVAGQSLTLDAVIGIAARSGPEDTAEKLLANADIARERARTEGGSVYFSAGMRERLAARRQTAHDLFQALMGDEIVPFFQPQIDVATGRIIGFEALVRWRHPERGVLNPHFFLDIADTAHLGGRITQIMLKKSVAALARWRALGCEVPRVALNLSARDLRCPELRDQIAFDLDRAGLAPEDLGIEVLESALIETDDDPILATIATLAKAGHHIDLDDFGTGHAALSYLRHATVDRLKIDRSFVRDLHRKPELRKMTLAMIQLAQTLGIRALAEGIETTSEWRTLVELGCDDLQGFAIGKPMPAEDVPAWIEAHDSRRKGGGLIAAA